MGDAGVDKRLQALEVTGTGVWESDLEGRTRFVTDQAAAMLGYEPEELIGRHVIDVMAAAPDQASTAWNLERRRDGESDVHEARLRHKDGHTVHVVVSAAPIFRDGRVCGSLAILVDVTSRKLGALDGREDASQELRDTHGVGRWELSVASGTITLSDEACEIFGLDKTVSQLAAEEFDSLAHPLDRPVLKLREKAALADGKPFSAYYRIVRPDGAVRIVHRRGSLTRDGDGGALRVTGTVQDVSGRLDGQGLISHRERDVLDLLAEGLTLAEIARRLQLSPHTVRTHVQNAISKLEAHNRAHAIVLALRAGELDL